MENFSLSPPPSIASMPLHTYFLLQKTEPWPIQNTLGKTQWVSYRKTIYVSPVTWRQGS